MSVSSICTTQVVDGQLGVHAILGKRCHAPERAGGIDIASRAIHPMVVLRKQTVLSSIFKLAATGEKFLQLTDVRT